MTCKAACAALALAVAAALAPVPAAAGVVITGNLVTSTVAGDTLDTDSITEPTIPAPFPVVMAASGPTTSTTLIDYAASGPLTTLSYTLQHARQGVNTFSARSFNVMSFTVDVDSTYALSASYAVTDNSQLVAGRVTLEVSLFDFTDAVFLFEQVTSSEFTLNESFTLGVAGGDDQNAISGALTGALLAGHTYLWNWNAFIAREDFSVADGSATATGEIALAIREVTAAAVPEPATLALFGLGLAGLGFTRRRMRG